jgi:hypothetical protein
MWIEERLEDDHLAPETRKELQALRRKALEGQLTQRELDEFRKRGEHHRDSLTAVSASLRAIRRRLAALPVVSPALLQELDVFLDHLKAATGAVSRASRSANAGWHGFQQSAAKVYAGGFNRSMQRDVITAR